MTPYLVAIAVVLAHIAALGLLIFVTAFLLRKSLRMKAELSKQKAVFLAYAFWVIVAGFLVPALSEEISQWFWLATFGLAIEALVSAALCLWLWQKYKNDP